MAYESYNFLQHRFFFLIVVTATGYVNEAQLLLFLMFILTLLLSCVYYIFSFKLTAFVL